VNGTEVIQKAINFCEENLTGEITVEELAAQSGYSVYHFCRMFQQAVGCGPMEYLRKRRLSEAAVAIADSRDYIKDVGFDWGFNSHENFVRAFRAQFGVSPSQFRQTQSSLNLVHPVRLGERRFEIPGPVVRFAVKPAFKLAGFACRTTFRKGANGKDAPCHWNRYHAERLYEQIGKPTDPATRWDIGILFDYDEKTSDISYLIGIEVDDFDGVNPECTWLMIPSAQYAVFNTPPATTETFVETIHRTWGYINCVWFPQTGFSRLKTHEFETYCEMSHTYSEEIWIPIGK